jgi:hypothetical protein
MSCCGCSLVVKTLTAPWGWLEASKPVRVTSARRRLPKGRATCSGRLVAPKAPARKRFDDDGDQLAWYDRNETDFRWTAASDRDVA